MVKRKQTQRLVITGGRGFIGSFLVEHLKESGYANIVIIGRRENKNIQKIIRKSDIVVHLAWTGVSSLSPDNLKENLRQNLFNSMDLLQICADKKIKKFIFISSGGAVYGDYQKRPFKETDICKPKSHYGILKLTTEKYIEMFGHIYNMSYAILRLANPYGRIIKDNKPRWAVDIFLKNAMECSPTIINGDGKTIRDYIHIKDAIRFIAIAIEKDAVRGVYNLGTGKGTSLNQLISIIEKTSKYKVAKKYKKKEMYDLNYSVLDISRALKTGWKPKFTLQNGIKQMYNDRAKKYGTT